MKRWQRCFNHVSFSEATMILLLQLIIFLSGILILQGSGFGAFGFLVLIVFFYLFAQVLQQLSLRFEQKYTFFEAGIIVALFAVLSLSTIYYIFGLTKV